MPPGARVQRDARPRLRFADRQYLEGQRLRNICCIRPSLPAREGVEAGRNHTLVSVLELIRVSRASLQNEVPPTRTCLQPLAASATPKRSRYSLGVTDIC
jgi:hypothetical protein